MNSSSVPRPLVDPHDVQAVKDALDVDVTDAGVGVYHAPTDRVYLRPSSRTSPLGHRAFVLALGLIESDCRGFVIAKEVSGRFVVENISQLNVASGGPNSLVMPQPLFAAIKQAVITAGL